MDKPTGHYAKENKPDTQRKLLYDLTFMSSNTWKQRVEPWLQGERRCKKWTDVGFS